MISRWENLNRNKKNSQENAAGAESAFDSLWREKWRELEQLKNARREALEREMQDAKLKLEQEMNRAKVEHDIMIKRREIERQQAELLQLQEIYENNARTQSGVLDTRNNILSNIDCNSQQQQNTFSGDATPVPQHAHTPVPQESSFSLHSIC